MDKHANYDCTVLSLCSGGAGLELGLQVALGSTRVVCWVEWEAFTFEILAGLMEKGFMAEAPMWADIRTFDGKPWRGVVDCITAGYPCQPFSVGGKRRGSDDNRYLWPHVHRIIGEVEPTFVFFENVQGHVALGFDQVARDLEQLGYSISAGLFTAEEVGTPQKRERLFILGIKEKTRTDGIDRRVNARAKRNKAHGSASKECVGQRNIPNPKGDDGHECEIQTDRRHTEKSGEVSVLPKTLESGGVYSNVPLWPFRPNQHEEWKQFVGNKPEFAPFELDVRNVADGMARDRILWIKMLGNGVVPLQSGYAFLSLWSAQRCNQVK